jgi:hypothetical protein
MFYILVRHRDNFTFTLPKQCICCSAFKTGMQCFDKYAQTCLNGDERKFMNRNVAGARHMFSYLCDDPSFQTGNIYKDNVSMPTDVKPPSQSCGTVLF